MKPLVPVFIALGVASAVIFMALFIGHRTPIEGYDDDPPLGIG